MVKNSNNVTHDNQTQELRRAIQKNDQKMYHILRKQSRQTHHLQDKVYEKVPEKVVVALNQAFLMAFKNLFIKGMPLIERTFSKQSLEIEHLSNDYQLNQSAMTQKINKLKEGNRFRNTKNKIFSTTEGTVLGLLGIGIPDVPIFISTLLRALYQTALSFGYTYDTPQERVYILRLIRLAMTESSDVFQMNQQLDELGQQLDRNDAPAFNMEEEIRLTSETLSLAMLVAKFIMTFPVVGVVGGLYNPKTLHRIDRIAALKYEKRYLSNKHTNRT